MAVKGFDRLEDFYQAILDAADILGIPPEKLTRSQWVEAMPIGKKGRRIIEKEGGWRLARKRAVVFSRGGDPSQLSWVSLHSNEEKHKELVLEILRVSGDFSIPVSSIGRDQFRKLSPIGTSGYVQLAGTWTRAKRAALGLEPDAVAETAPTDVIPEGFNVTQVSSNTNVDGEIEGQWIKSRRNDQEPAFEDIPDGLELKGVSTYRRADGAVDQWVLARTKTLSKEEILEKLLRELPERIPVREEIIPSPKLSDADDLLAVYPVGDPHIGLLAWSEETLGSDYDITIADQLLRKAVDELVSNSPRASTALVVNLGDFFHSDTQENKTMRQGNALDVDGRWAKVLRVGLDIMIHIIDRCLEEHNSVRLINEIGNHDDHSAIMLSIALDRHYSNEPRIEVDMSPARFHYHQFGQVLLGVTHGHVRRKPEDLESIMAHDCADMWSETTHRHWLTGHIHSVMKKSTRNCVIESFNTLAPNDAWHAEQGYRGARDMTRIVYHQTHGEIARSVVSSGYLRDRLKR